MIGQILREKRIILLLFLTITMIRCEQPHHRGITDIIPRINLKAGNPDTLQIEDLFYAEDYKLNFKQHPDIDIRYHESNRQLILVADGSAEGLNLIEFEMYGTDYVMPVKTQVLQKITFTYHAGRDDGQIHLFGSFNNWNRHSITLTDEDGDGIYQTTITLEPGRYEYKFFVDGQEIVDPGNPEKVANPFGAFNSVITVRPRHEDRIFLHLMDYDTTGSIVKLGYLCQAQTEIVPLGADHVLALLNNTRLPDTSVQINGRNIVVSIPKDRLQGENRLRIAVSRHALPAYFHTVQFSNGVPRGTEQNDFSWYDAIFYSIMIDRFHDGNKNNTVRVDHPDLHPKANYYGGDLEGILKKLRDGYFEDLGINVLWLSPVNQNPEGAYPEYPPPHRLFTGYHGYWPVHHREVDKRFGNMSLFQQLVEEAHMMGIRVILDFVANHVHENHVFFQKYPEWFGTLELPNGRKNIRMWDEQRLTTWFDTFLPSFDYPGSDQALETMTGNAVWWLQKTNIDGFRQDAVKHIPNKFWRTLTRKIKKEIEADQNRTFFQIGETFGGYDLISSYVNNGQLTSQFNFNLYDAALYTFLTPEAGFNILDAEMKKTFRVYGMNHLMGNLMDSHDKVRYMAYADQDLRLNSENKTELGWENPPVVNDKLSYQKARLYLAYMLTIPGVPVIYYGDEIGMTGAADPDNRRPMRFSPNLVEGEKEMLEAVRKIIAIRRDNAALRYGDYFPVYLDGAIYAYLRSYVNQRILVVLNKGDEKKKLQIKLPDFYRIQSAVDLLNKVSLPVENDCIHLKIDQYDYQIFGLEN